MISSAYKLCAQLIDDRLPARGVEHLPVPLLRRRQLVDGRHARSASRSLKSKLLPRVNMFAYGQVESPYGSGQFIKDLREHFGKDDRVVTSEIRDKDAIVGVDQGVPRARGSKRSHERVRAEDRAARVPARRAEQDREARARGRARLLPDRLRDPHVRPDERDRGVRRLPEPLPALALRDGVRAARQELRVRPLEDLRDGHQQQPLVRVPARGKLARRPEARHGARATGTSTSSRTTSASGSTDLDTGGRTVDPVEAPEQLRPEPPLDRQDGQPRLARLRRIVARQGINKVEEFVDHCLSLENLIDLHAPFSGQARQARSARTRSPRRPRSRASARRTTWSPSSTRPSTSRSSARRSRPSGRRRRSSPSTPSATSCSSSSTTRRSSAGSATCSRSIREEAYYFAPQWQTKIMNEGWATYWHSRLMTEKILDASEIIDYADHAAGVLATSGGRLNPYKLGVELYPPHRGALGQGAVRQGVGGVRRPRGQEELEPAPRARARRRSSRCARSTTTSPSSTSS